MNNTQKALLAIYLPLTAFFLIADRLYPGESLVNYIKFTTVVTLFLAALVISKRRREQKQINLAILFAVIGDFFLNFGSTLPISGKLVPLGMAGFMVAYIILIAALQKNFKLGRNEILAALPVLGVFIPIFIILSPHITGPMFIGALVFGLVLSYMAWTSICTLFWGYYSPGVARHLALAGYLLFVSDLAVALILFHPAYAGHFVPWLKNIIWGTFIPAWAVIVTVVAEDNLLASAPTPITEQSRGSFFNS